MLDAFVIEEIKRRERIREEGDRPVVQLPVPEMDDHPRRRTENHDEDKPQRGVIVIEMAF